MPTLAGSSPILAVGLALALALPGGWLAARATAPFVEEPAGRTTAPFVVATAVVFGWAAISVGPPQVLALTLVLGWSLVCLARIDAAAYRLPDVFTVPLALVGLAATALLPGTPLADHVVGAVLGYCGLAALAWVYRRSRGVDGIGLGDAKLLAAGGAWLGWRGLPSVLILACAAAFLWIGLTVAIRGRSALRQRIAFGVPLCLSIWLNWIIGPLVSI